VFSGDFNKIVGDNKKQFLDECTTFLSKDGTLDVECRDVLPGSIIVVLGGSTQAVTAAVGETVAGGLDLPSFDALPKAQEADLDECADTSTNDCSPNAICTNTAGGFTCACKPDYEGDGRTCVKKRPSIGFHRKS